MAAHNVDGHAAATPPFLKRHHQRKKSAPATVVSSPVDDDVPLIKRHLLGLEQAAIKKNLSSDALPRDGAGILAKKSVQNGGLKTRPKKTVGFQLAAESDTEDEWEEANSTRSQSPASVRPDANMTVARPGSEQHLHPYQQYPTKSPLVQTSSAEPTAAPPDTSAIQSWTLVNRSGQFGHAQPMHQPPAKAKAQVSAAPVEAQAPIVASKPTPISTSTTSTQGASSLENGVSRFLDSNEGESAPNTTPSSYVTPPSRPDPPSKSQSSPSFEAASRQAASRGGPESAREPALPRPEKTQAPGGYRSSGLQSRTQQKLWLQRDAPLPVPRAASAVGSMDMMGFMDGFQAMPTALDPRHVGGLAGLRPAGSFGGASFNSYGGGPFVNEARRDQKIFAKHQSEYSVVLRFRSPVTESFARLQTLANSNQATAAIFSSAASTAASLAAGGSRWSAGSSGSPSPSGMPSLNKKGAATLAHPHSPQRSSILSQLTGSTVPGSDRGMRYTMPAPAATQTHAPTSAQAQTQAQVRSRDGGYAAVPAPAYGDDDDDDRDRHSGSTYDGDGSGSGSGSGMAEADADIDADGDAQIENEDMNLMSSDGGDLFRGEPKTGVGAGAEVPPVTEAEMMVRRLWDSREVVSP